jgi:hypothetical protein
MPFSGRFDRLEPVRFRPVVVLRGLSSVEARGRAGVEHPRRICMEEKP